MKSVNLRFYEELNDFLPERKKKTRFNHQFSGKPSIKDMIESIGIPHGEVDLILVNGISVGFNYIVNDNDDISVYPVFEFLDIKDVQHLREKPLRQPKFIADVHLGTLTKYLRMLGIDTAYKNNYTDNDLIRISLKEKRAILTKDVGLLKHNIVTHGYYVRGIDPEVQSKEIILRFNLLNYINAFSRCLKCNLPLQKIDKEKVTSSLPDKVRANQNEFYLCEYCGKIYWQGSHYERMKKIINRIISTLE